MTSLQRIHAGTRRWTGALGWGLAAALALGGWPAAADVSTRTAVEPDELMPRVVAEFGKLPPTFVENRGQTDGRVRFSVRLAGYTAFLAEDEVVFAGNSQKGETRRRPAYGLALYEPSHTPRPVVRVRFGGGRAQHIEGLERAPGESNFYRGADPARWVTGAPHYGRVAYREVWPGIDVVFYGDAGELEYDFVVAPGADPQRIDLRFEGADGLHLDQGDLNVQAGRLHLRHLRPSLYQEAAGGRRPIDGHFATRGADGVGLQVASYDARKPLVIDPRVQVSTFFGGAGIDTIDAVGVTPTGHVIVAGTTNSADFPAGNAPPDDFAVFVTKLDPTGSFIVNSTLLDGNGDDLARDLAVDSVGNVYVAGAASRNFPTLNGYDESHSLFHDAFVTKLNLGGSLVFSTFLGGSGDEIANGIALDSSNRVYVVGGTTSDLTFPTENRYQGCGLFSGSYTEDAFLTVLEPAGNALLYSTCFGGNNVDEAKEVAVDAAGNAYVGGITNSNGLPTKSPSSLPPFQASRAGGDDGFVAKFDPHQSGNSSLVYSTFLGGSADERLLAVAVEPVTQRAYVTGGTVSSNFPIVGGFDGNGSGADAFVTKLNADGTALFYSTFLGGSGGDIGTGIAVDAAGNAYVAGTTNSSDFGRLQQFEAPTGGGEDAFVVKVSADGSRELYSVVRGGGRGEVVNNLAVDAFGNAYVVGQTASGGTYPTTPGAVKGSSTANVGTEDGFIFKLSAQNADTIGIWRPFEVRFLLRNTNTSDTGRQNFQFGLPSDVPICGDWDGDGDKTCGIYRDGNFQLLNVHTGLGSPSFVFNLAGAVQGDQPLAGDWDGDGKDGVGVFTTTGQFLLDNNLDGTVDVPPFGFGLPTDIAIAGDWDGDGDDSVGIFRDGSFQLIFNNVTSFKPNVLANFGAAGDVPVVGDWDGDGITTIGVYTTDFLNRKVFELRNSNTPGAADLRIGFGLAGDIPLAGDWNGRP